MFLINLRLGNDHCRQLNDTVGDRLELQVDGLDLGFQVAEALGRAFVSHSQRDFVDLVTDLLLPRRPARLSVSLRGVDGSSSWRTCSTLSATGATSNFRLGKRRSRRACSLRPIDT